MKSVLSLLLVAFSCSGLFAQQFTLNCTIKGLDTGYILIKYNDEFNQQKSVVSSLQNGQVSFSGTINRVADILLTIDSTKVGVDFNSFRYLYIEPGYSEAFFPSSNLREISYKGSKAQFDWDSLRTIKKTLRFQQNIYGRIIDSIRSKLKNGEISHHVADSLLNINIAGSSQIGQMLNKIDIGFIKANPSSFASFTVLRELVGYIHVDSIDLLYNIIDPRNYGSYLDYDFVKYFSRYRKSITDEYPFDRIKIGKPAPAFRIWNSIDSLLRFDLSAYIGQITIIEFWGLNCIPCLKQNLVLDSLNKATGGRIKVIAVSNTTELDYPKLLNYIGKNEFMNWTYVQSGSADWLKNAVIYLGDFHSYKGAGIPRTVLVDQKGNVVLAKNGYSHEQITQLANAIQDLIKSPM